MHINVAIILLQTDKMKMDQSEMESDELWSLPFAHFGTEFMGEKERMKPFDRTIQRFTFYLNFR